MNKRSNPVGRFFGVVGRGQTYLNLIYLILAFPLGLMYLIFFTVGISVALPLMFVLIGFVVLAFVCVGWWAFAAFERLMAIWLLKMEIAPMSKPGPQPEGAWENFKSLLTNPVTWKSLFYLIIKLPLGVLSLTLLILFGGVTLAFLTAPLTFWWSPITVDLIGTRTWAIDTPVEAAFAFIIGLLTLVVAFHVWNYMAYVSGVFARQMLGNERMKLSEFDNEGILKEAEDLIRPVEALPEQPVQPEDVWQPADEAQIVTPPAIDDQPQLVEPAAETPAEADDEITADLEPPEDQPLG
jgi:Putative sensor